MPNHLHLLIRVGRIPLSIAMQHILTRYACHVNSRRKVLGHVFQGRFKAFLCQNDAHLLGLLRYIHMNPVRAGLAACPSQWPWSSHAHYLGLRDDMFVDPAFPLSILHPDPDRVRRLFARFLGESSGNEIGLPCAPKSPDPVPADLCGRQDDRPEDDPASGIEGLDYLGRRVAQMTGIGLDALKGPSRIRAMSAARRELVRLALSHGFGTCAIARFLGRSPTSVYKAVLNKSPTS